MRSAHGRSGPGVCTFRGCCPGCRADRLLPGRGATGTPICRDCAGIARDFFCDRCGFEGLLLGGRLCERCTLTDTLGRLLDDGTGHVAASLQPLVTSLKEMDRPKSRLIWLRNPNVVRLLRGGRRQHPAHPRRAALGNTLANRRPPA
ncbi:hypothetical protein ABT298_22975 [Streptomyces sp. NPDC001034]|uniref:hypothetical protein n=1 Tax=Streptomyces sp. NPDC001034 TaxID=3154375 RepID=UPI00332B8C3A